MNATDATAIRTGVRVVLDRQLRAYDDFVAQIAAAAPEVDAPKVAALYRKLKVIKFDGMRYIVKHGAYWDREVLLRANRA